MLKLRVANFHLQRLAVDGWKAVQEMYHLQLLQVQHGYKPTRNQSAESRMENDRIHSAWDELGDLSSMNVTQRNFAYSSFLEDMRGSTALFLAAVSEGNGMTNIIWSQKFQWIAYFSTVFAFFKRL